MAKPLTRRLVHLVTLVVFLIGTIFFVQLLLEAEKAEERLRTARAATALGAKIHYDWQFDDKMRPKEIKDFVRWISGNPALYAQIVHVDLTGSRFSDEDLSLLESFDDANWIIVGDCNVTDRGIVALSKKLPSCTIRR